MEIFDNQIHFVPQYSFVCNQNGKIEMDFVGKFESLEKDSAFVAQKIGVYTSLPHRNMTRTRRWDYQAYYGGESAEILVRLYPRDIELFHYSFDSGI